MQCTRDALIAQGTRFRGCKVATPVVSRGETGSTRVLATRELAGTRAPNTQELGATRTRDGYWQRECVLANTRRFSYRGTPHGPGRADVAWDWHLTDQIGLGP